MGRRSRVPMLRRAWWSVDIEVHHHGMEVRRKLPDGTGVFFIDHPSAPILPGQPRRPRRQNRNGRGSPACQVLQKFAALSMAAARGKGPAPGLTPRQSTAALFPSMRARLAHQQVAPARAKIPVGTLYSKAHGETLNEKPAWPAAPHEHCWLIGCIFAGFAKEHRAISAPTARLSLQNFTRVTPARKRSLLARCPQANAA